MKDVETLSRAHFNRQAAVYDEKNTAYYSKMPKISCHDAAEYLKNVEYDTLLDVGCGTGYLLALLARQNEAAYNGLDLAEEMLHMAEKKQIPGASFVLGTADSLPYGDNCFDVVTCIQSFHHYPQPDKALKEALRVLKPGGLYVLSDTGVGGIGAWIDNHIIFPLMKSGDCHTANKNGIAKRMEKNGFQVIEKKQLVGFVYTVIGRK